MSHGAKPTLQLGNKPAPASAAAADTPLPDLTHAILEDSPRSARLMLWALVAFLLTGLLWAHFAKVEELTRGLGKAIPPGKLQRVQNLEGGIVAGFMG